MPNKNNDAEKPEASEPEIQIKEVKVPIKPEELSTQELEKLQNEIETTKIKKHLESEKKKIESIKCPNCNKKLGLDPENYLKTGNTPERIECPKCEKLIKVFIKYPEDPTLTITNAEINLSSEGYAWETQLPSTWTDKHVLRWVEQEAQNISKGRSSLTPEAQKLFKMNYIVMKKQKLIK